MDNSGWQQSQQDRGQKMERCLFGKEEVLLPQSLIEQNHIFSQVISQDTWNRVLTESQRQHLMKLLPSFPENDTTEKKESVRRLFAGENFKFGNPLKYVQEQLKDGSYSPDISKYASMCHSVKMEEHKHRQQRYYAGLLKEILLSRQRVFQQLSHLPPDEPIKFEYVPPKRKENPIHARAKRKYFRLLREVRDECGVTDTSSEEEETSPVERSKKQLFKSLCPVPSPEPVVPSVQATYSAKPPLMNGDAGDGEKVSRPPRNISPVDITEDHYRKLLLKYRHMCAYFDVDENEDHPEFNTQNITLQDVMSRCHASRKGGEGDNDDALELTPLPPVRKKLKRERLEKRFKRKPAAKKISEMDLDASNAGNEADDETTTNVSVDISVDDNTVGSLSVDMNRPTPEATHYASFFSLLRDEIARTSDKRISTSKLEERVRVWQCLPDSDLSDWIVQLDNWPDAVASALKFLAGESIGMNVDEFVPYLDYKERAQQWQWIGAGRDSDDTLKQLCDHWLRHRAAMPELSLDVNQASPPPSRSKTSYTVRPTSEEEKEAFQEQERLRFENPQRAFTYALQDYESIVGPVKGVFNKKTDMTKAREHALLISIRPAYVTILTLVRDAAARLPNGEGTRGEICELLKDSQFLAPGIADAQINVVVSGALDRLHSEKDPCVKYDVNRKVWIYLHRSRTEEEFEKIHQAQAAAVKAKKSLVKPKIPKTPKADSSQLTHTKLRTEGLVVDDLTLPHPVVPTHLLGTPLSQGPRGLSPGSHRPGVQSPRAGPTTNIRQVISNIMSVAHASDPVTMTTSAPGRSAGVTQSLTPAQLELLQQAAQAQAAHVKAQAQAQAAKAHAETLARTVTKTAGEPVPKSSAVSQAGNLGIQGHGRMTYIPTPTHLTPVVTVAQNILIPAKPDVVLQRQLSDLRTAQAASPQSQGQGSPSIVTKPVTFTTGSVETPTMVTGTTQPGTNPLMARLVQHMSGGGQMVSVSNLLAAQKLQASQPRMSTAFKIQGGNLIQQVTGGKPVHLGGKPLAQAKGQLVHLGGKGQSPLGVIQTPQGTINIIPQTGASGGVVTISQPKAVGSMDMTQTVASATQVSQSKTLAHQGATIQTISQSKALTQTASGIVTQMATGGITLRPGGTMQGQTKVISQGKPGLVPTQFVLQAPGSIKISEAQSGSATSGNAPLLVTTNSGNAGSPNLQMIRTVLSQQGLKPGQTTLLISQPAGGLQQAGTVLPPGQVLHTVRPQGRATQKAKPPMYARIITPPAGMRLPGHGAMLHTGGQTIAVHNEAAMLQTVSKILSASAPVSTTVGSASIATSQQILAAAAAGKAIPKTEPKDTK